MLAPWKESYGTSRQCINEQRHHFAEKSPYSQRRRGQQRIKWLDGITGSTDMSFSKLREMVKDWEAWRAAVCRICKQSDTTSN